MARSFDLQAHRGGRGLRPESTLPAFEHALDLGVSTLELDLHFTRDRAVVVWHDPQVSPKLLRRVDPLKPWAAPPALLSTLTVADFREFIADVNPDPKLWPKQLAKAGPLAIAFAQERWPSPFTPITLQELFQFTAAYASTPGKTAGKSDAQRQRAAAVRFNLELKRVPFHPEAIADGFVGKEAGPFEKAVVALVGAAGVEERCTLQSFDHRSLAAVWTLNPRIKLAALVGGSAPASVPKLLEACGATIYSPDYRYLDETMVKQIHAAGFTVLPWTVNASADVDRLLDWEVDGLITDLPDLVIPKLQGRHWEF